MFKEFFINVWKEIKPNVGPFLKSFVIVLGAFAGFFGVVHLIGYFVHKAGYMLEENLFNAGIPVAASIFLAVVLIAALYLFWQWNKKIWIRTYLMHKKEGKTNLDHLIDEVKKDRGIED